MKAYPIENTRHLDPLLDAIGDRRIVLLGEASHGTSEYYNWRKVITKRLIEEKGFDFIAVEGDWPECNEINRFVKGYSDAAAEPLPAVEVFGRWPTWMWGNWEVVALVKWLWEYNEGRSAENRIGFYGLDIYSLYDSLERVLNYLSANDGETMELARKAFGCFEPYHDDPKAYASATGRIVPKNCEEEVVALLQEIKERLPAGGNHEEAAFNNEQNARVAVHAERYYRTMLRGGAASWNVRDHHMMDTLKRLLDYYGPDSKAVVWAHNTHIGDARATDMSEVGMVNLGQLAREAYGPEACFLVGFGAYMGSLIAASRWGASMQEMALPPAKKDSWEDRLFQLGEGDLLVLSGDLRKEKALQQRIPHRAVGVVYHPALETSRNYVPSLLSERYDAFLYFEHSEALHPLALHPVEEGLPQTYPWEV